MELMFYQLKNNEDYIRDTCDKCARCSKLPIWNGKELYCRNCGTGAEATRLWQAVTQWNKKQREK